MRSTTKRGETVSETEWVQVDVRTSMDAGEVLGLLNDPAVTGAWQEGEVVHLYWPAASCGPETWMRLRQALAQLGHDHAEKAIRIGRLADRDWNEQWARLVEPVRIGRVVIRPSWKSVLPQDDDVTLTIDPKQAFGTGHHATTQLLIAWLQEVVRPHDRVLDMGTGSGILAMVALRLGAAQAVGVDNDPTAIDCAREYAEVNGFDGRLTLSVGDVGSDAAASALEPTLVLANLDRQTLLDCRGPLCGLATGGARLLLSGLLSEQRNEIESAYAALGVYVKGARERDGWVALEAVAMEGCEGGFCS